ncbi:hypothetical protein Vretimale_2035 [Volvox reticuliferus]|nr:hypothetical protein Vretimale_2035 [Volvox reticuliferus]
MLNQSSYNSREVITRLGQRNLRLRSALLHVLVLTLSAVGITCQIQVPIATWSLPPPVHPAQPESGIRPQLIASIPVRSSSPAPSPTFPPTSTPAPALKPSPEPAPKPAPKATPKPPPKSGPKPAPKPATQPAPSQPPKPSRKPFPKPAIYPSPRPSSKQPSPASSPKPATGRSPWQPPPQSRPPIPRPRRRSSPLVHLSPPAPPMTPPRWKRAKNGLRLVYGAGGTGRLEARIVTEWFMQVGYNENGGWAPLCDDGSFDDQRAQEFCAIMGYAFGRKYYGISISTFGEDEPQPPPTPLGDLQCVDAEASWHGFPTGKIDLPDSLGYKCFVFPSPCRTRAMVALQCSNKPLRVKPPPPPLPPTAAAATSVGSPPPPPPAAHMQHAINLLSLEDNLVKAWPAIADLLSEPKRVELLVNSSADGRTGEAVWAPLCASPEQLAANRDYQHFGSVIANTSCHQYEDFPTSWFSWLHGTEQEPVPIPKAVGSLWWAALRRTFAHCIKCSSR